MRYPRLSRWRVPTPPPSKASPEYVRRRPFTGAFSISPATAATTRSPLRVTPACLMAMAARHHGGDRRPSCCRRRSRARGRRGRSRAPGWPGRGGRSSDSPRRRSPVMEVSRWPLNIMRGPPPSPRMMPTALARFGPISWSVTSSPPRSMRSAMKAAPPARSDPVGLGMLTRSTASRVTASWSIRAESSLDRRVRCSWRVQVSRGGGQDAVQRAGLGALQVQAHEPLGLGAVSGAERGEDRRVLLPRLLRGGPPWTATGRARGAPASACPEEAAPAACSACSA